jgi:hypothetical protein
MMEVLELLCDGGGGVVVGQYSCYCIMMEALELF